MLVYMREPDTEEVVNRRQIVTILCPVLYIPTTLFPVSRYHLRGQKNQKTVTIYRLHRKSGKQKHVVLRAMN